MGRLYREPAKRADDIPYFLTDKETQRHGVSIGKAMHAGILTPDDFRELLAFCRECHDGKALRAEPGHDKMADCAPDWCANRAVLEGLRGII